MDHPLQVAGGWSVLHPRFTGIGGYLKGIADPLDDKVIMRYAGALPVADYDCFNKAGSNGYFRWRFYFDLDVFTCQFVSI